MQSKLVEGDLERVLERLLWLLRQMPATGDLSLAAAATMARLESEGPHRLTDLAAREGQSQPAMTQLVTRLERAGLVHRTPVQADRRVVMVDVTALGRELLQRRRNDRSALLRHLLRRLDRDEQAAIARALPVLCRLVEIGLDGGQGVGTAPPAARPPAARPPAARPPAARPPAARQPIAGAPATGARASA